MSIYLRIILVVCSILCFLYVMRKVRKTQMSIDDSLFWILFCLFIVVIGLFPKIMMEGARKIGVESPVNFVFLIIIFILIIKLFSQSIKLSQMENKLKNVIQQIAIREKELNDKKDD